VERVPDAIRDSARAKATRLGGWLNFGGVLEPLHERQNPYASDKTVLYKATQ